MIYGEAATFIQVHSLNVYIPYSAPLHLNGMQLFSLIYTQSQQQWQFRVVHESFFCVLTWHVLSRSISG